MSISACFDQLSKMVVRDTIYSAWALEPWFMFMNNSPTFEPVTRQGREDACFLKYLNTNIPKPTEDKCCDPNECFGPLKETQFNRMTCESFIFESKKIILAKSEGLLS